MVKNKTSPRLVAIDWLRVIAILAVILIHTTTRTLEISTFNLSRLPLTFFLNQSSRFAVPLFFLISGFVLELNRPFSLSKRLKRILIPYLFWSLIYYYFVYPQHKISFLSALLTGDASYQLYFIPVLAIFYLLFPLFCRLTNKFLLISLFIGQLVLLAYDYYFKPLALTYPFRVALLNYAIFLLGIISARHQSIILNFINKFKYFILVWIFFLAGLITYEGRFLYFKTHNYWLFYSSWRPSIFVYTLSLASLLYYLLNKINGFSKISQKLAELSFSVFFIHVIFIELITIHLGRLVHLDLLFFFTVAFLSYLTALVLLLASSKIIGMKERKIIARTTREK